MASVISDSTSSNNKSWSTKKRCFLVSLATSLHTLKYSVPKYFTLQAFCAGQTFFFADMVEYNIHTVHKNMTVHNTLYTD